MKISITVLCLTTPLLAQGAVTVPSAAAAAEGNALVGVSGVGFSAVQQVVIDASQPTPLVGHSITAAQLRRDGGSAGAFSAGSAQLVVRVGSASHGAASASPEFAANLPNPVEVFRGTVTIPAASAPATPPVPWDASHAVTIPFSPAFAYAGGPLCIEIDGTVTGGAWWWPVDGAIDSAIGAVTRLGSACGPFALQSGQVAAVATRDLVPGETALLAYRGTPNAAAILAIGIAPLPQAIDLGILGAPGCAWWIDPVLLLPTVVGPALPQPGVGGFANVNLQLPAGPAFLGASFAVQWLEVSTPLVASEAYACQLSSSLPGLGIAVVFQDPDDPAPRVDFSTAPVLRFEWQ